MIQSLVGFSSLKFHGMKVLSEFQFVGIFGWSCTPAAFQVVTRAISFELCHWLTSRTLTYVDDVIGICMASDIEEDIKRCTDAGSRVEVTGYVIDLDRRLVSIARKNFLNTIYGFLSMDLSMPS